MVTILMMSAKMATPDLRKIIVKKIYGVIISVNDRTNKTLSRDLKLYSRCGHLTKVW